MSIFVTADHHFGHANIIRFVNRPFANVDEMDQGMIDAWNAVVGWDDEVYHLGDFTLGDSLSPWIHALQFGTLKIVPGGHDWRWLKKADHNDLWNRNIEVISPLHSLELPSGEKYPKIVVLCHYPMAASHWDRAHYGSFHFYGHTHGRFYQEGKALDVGVDNIYRLYGEFRPILIDDALGYLADGGNDARETMMRY